MCGVGLEVDIYGRQYRMDLLAIDGGGKICVCQSAHSVYCVIFVSIH